MANAKMSLREKAELLTGCDSWHTNEAQDIRALFFSDGPAGVRCEDRSRPQDAFNKYESFPATCIPCGSAVGASFDLPLIEEVYAALGAEAAYFGIDVLLAPAMNLKRIPLGGRNFEYFSEDPYHSGLTAAAAVRGIQSVGVGACVKHFAANNTEFERFSIDTRMDEETLRELYLRGFEIAVKEGKPLCVMGAYTRLNGTYCCHNRRLLTQILREEWGFDGLVISDWGAVHDRAAALAAGCDLAMPFDKAFGGELSAAVEEGRVSEALLDESIARIRTLAERTKDKCAELADFEGGYALARRLAEESVVLLKNDGILPLSEKAKLLVLGTAAKHSKYLGGGSAECKAYRVTEPYDALLSRFGQVVYADGADVREACALARGCDVAVVFLSSAAGHDTEGQDLSTMASDPQTARLCAALAAEHIPHIVALQTGTPVEMPFFAGANAVLQCHLLGEAGGEAVADILCGRVDPSGRLSESIPVCYERSPGAGYDADPAVMPYAEGLRMGYRHYYTHREDVLLPFGYGLSYASFAYRAVRVTEEDGLFAEVTLENVSSRMGRETVQIYVQDPARDFRALKGFCKTTLAAGETKTVRVPLDEYAFSRYDAEAGAWKEGKGTYTVAAAKHALDEGICCTWVVK